MDHIENERIGERGGRTDRQQSDFISLTEIRENAVGIATSYGLEEG
jgi:hypothetical protein